MKERPALGMEVGVLADCFVLMAGVAMALAVESVEAEVQLAPAPLRLNIPVL